MRNAADLALLEGIQVVAGSLTIESVPGGALTLPDLEVVSYQLVLSDPSGGLGELPESLVSASFPALRRAGGLEARFLPSLASISAPRLERLGSLDLAYDDALVTVSLPQLAEVDDLILRNQSVLASVTFPALAQAQWLRVSNNALLASFSAPQLRELAQNLDLYSNPALSTCAAWRVLAGLTTAPRSSFVADNDETPTCLAADVCAAPQTITGVADPLRVCLRPLPFADAQTTCAGLGTGAALAWVTSDAEWVALSAAASAGDLRSVGWIGYTDAATEGTWVTAGGFTGYSPTSRMDFWAPGEPSDTTGAENAAELYADGLVGDADGAQPRPFLCRAP